MTVVERAVGLLADPLLGCCCGPTQRVDLLLINAVWRAFIHAYCACVTHNKR
jgi:hypothetical protein